MANTKDRQQLVEQLISLSDRLNRSSNLGRSGFDEVMRNMRRVCDELRTDPDAEPPATPKPPPTTVHITSTLHTEVHELQAMVSGLQILAGNSGEDVGLSGFELMMLLDPVHTRLTEMSALLEGDPLQASQRRFMQSIAAPA